MHHDRNRSVSDWSPEIWAWSPAAGRWTPEFGQPKQCVYLEISTDGLKPDAAYDYWRETVFYNFDADRQPVEQDFQGHVKGLISPRGAFYSYASSAVSGRSASAHVGAAESDDIDLGVVFSGRRFHEEQGGATTALGPGGMYLYNPAHAARVAWEPHRGAHVTLKRAAVATALGEHACSSGRVAEALSASGLAPFLLGQFRLLARHIDGLSGVERAAILDNTIDLALAALRTASRDQPIDQGAQRRGLFIAAQRYVEDNLSRPNLDARRIAQAVGCARATLYRAFADQGLTVSQYIRDARLHQLRQYLQASSQNVSIGDLAARCGLYDAANLSRIFRAAFGMSPSEYREMHQNGR